MESLGASPAAAPFVAPGVHDQEHKDEEAQNQQKDDARPGLPQRPKAFGEFGEVHATPSYTTLKKN